MLNVTLNDKVRDLFNLLWPWHNWETIWNDVYFATET